MVDARFVVLAVLAVAVVDAFLFLPSSLVPSCLPSE